MSEPDPLAALESDLARQIDLLAYPAAPWVAPLPAPDGAPALDCAIIGGGMYGLAVAAALRREQVRHTTIFDAAPAGREGPWVTFARMAMLRTPKDLTGPDGGLPAASFRAWWEATHGPAAWDALYRVPRTAWMAYLNWLRRVLDLPVQNGWRLVAMQPVADGTLLQLEFATPEGPVLRHARSVVMATGSGGSGGHAIPPEIAAALPEGRVLHANDAIDLAGLRGQRIGVLGAGATAFDVAIAALQAGAATATVCVRRPTLPRDNPRRWMENAGFLAHYVDLPDGLKWAYAMRLRRIGQPPPQPTFDAALALPGFRLATGMPAETVRWTGQEILVEGQGRRQVFDRLVIATGFLSDLALCPEYAALAPRVALWRDRYVPPAEAADARLGRQPYLDRFGGFQESQPGTAPWVGRVFSITGAASLSLGPVAASVSGMKYALPRLVEGVKRRLFLDQQEADWAHFVAGEHAELAPFDLPESVAA
ncbi:FAD/NAD(P)-binding protein [Falsiroseomonas selenitidurans]|uniref:NAD(P)/FAD-dependent oxidoreductase n=1 Tax=Falsiroseomonas selenitidurans TaxID=2716335 RepID=A0ABX1E048_9PROT|nr:NAD(P)/FAD-dependent oxidoreductase [Falsiroseomonas selenitidurans]NKC30511.1 NAD(P)/FAD-dependent oxidoreductase [Falsiroseomonas selenitidurans]